MLRTFVKISILTGMTLGMFSTEKAWADSQFVYLGAEPVLSWTHFIWQNADTSSNSTPDANGETVIGQTTGALQAGIFTGYGVVIDWIYLDVEGGFNWENGRPPARHSTKTLRSLFITQKP